MSVNHQGPARRSCRCGPRRRRHIALGVRTVVLPTAILTLALSMVVGGCRTSSLERPSRGGFGPAVNAPDNLKVDLPERLVVAAAYSPGIVFTGGDGNLWSLSTRDGSRRRLLPALTNAASGWKVVRFEVAPGGKLVAVLLHRSNAKGRRGWGRSSLLVVAPLGGKELWRTAVSSTLGEPIHDLPWSPDGKRLVFKDGPRRVNRLWMYDLVVFDSELGRSRRLYSAPPAPSHWGDNMAHYAWRGSRAVLVEVAKAARIRGKGVGYRDGWQLVRLDGSVHPAPAGMTEDIAKYGAEAARLLRAQDRGPFRKSAYNAIGGAAFAQAAWSPDHRRLAFLGARTVRRKAAVGEEIDNKSELWLIDAKSKRASVLERGSWESRVVSLSWSGDGTSIFYWREVPRETKAKRTLRHEMDEAMRKRDDPAAERVDAAWRNLSFADSASWLYLVSVRPDGSGRKIWLRQLGDWGSRLHAL